MSVGGPIGSIRHVRRRANITRANLSNVVEITLGRALDTLPHLTGPFDLVFIDADKPSNPDYFKWAVKLTHHGEAGAGADPVASGALLHEGRIMGGLEHPNIVRTLDSGEDDGRLFLAMTLVEGQISVSSCARTGRWSQSTRSTSWLRSRLHSTPRTGRG